MGCIFSKQPDNDKSTTGTSGLDSPLLGGNSERSDLQPTQPVSTSKPRDPKIQAELDNRKEERDKKRDNDREIRKGMSEKFREKRKTEKEALQIKAQQSAATVAANTAKRAEHFAKLREKRAAAVADDAADTA